MRGFSQIWLIVGILIMVAGGAYYLGKSTSPKPSPPPVETSLDSPAKRDEQTPKSTSIPSICTTESSSIKYLVDTLENLQMKKDALKVLALFTPPVTNNDIDTYNYFSGKKMGFIGLYGNVTTNFNELSYKITSDPTENSTGCMVKVEERISAYSNAGTSIGYQPPQLRSTTIEIIKEGNSWKIDKYYPAESMPKKYGAWGY